MLPLLGAHSSWLSNSVGISQDSESRQEFKATVLPWKWPSAVRTCIKFGSGEASSSTQWDLFFFGPGSRCEIRRAPCAPSLVTCIPRAMRKSLAKPSFILIIVICRLTLCAVLIWEHSIPGCTSILYLFLCLGEFVWLSVN